MTDAAMQAVPAGQTGIYREREIHPALAHVFSTVWIHEAGDGPAPPILVAPDAAIDLQWIAGRFRVAGPDTAAQIEILPPGGTVVGFRFRPAAAAAWLGVPADELTDRRVFLDDIWGANARHLAREIADSGDLDGAIRSLTRVLARAKPRGATPRIDDAMARVFATMSRAGPGNATLVPRLSRMLAMSERTLRRRFDAVFGYGPKTLDRILRYRGFLALARNSHVSLAELALEAGYADQAHLSREVRRMSGVTATELLAGNRG